MGRGYAPPVACCPFSSEYRWHYCCLDADGTHAWLLGCPREVRGPGNGDGEEYLSDVLSIDLRKFGLLGNKLSQEPISEQKIPIGADLARILQPAPGDWIGHRFRDRGFAR